MTAGSGAGAGSGKREAGSFYSFPATIPICRTSRSSASSTSAASTTSTAKKRRDTPVLYDSRDLVTHARLRRHDGQRQDRAVPLADRGGGDRRRARDRDRSEGGHRQPAADVPEPRAGGLPAVDRRGRGAARRRHGRRLRGARRRSAGARAWRRGDRMARGSSGCAVPRISRSTRRAASAGLPVSILSSFAAPPRRAPETTRKRWRAGGEHGDERAVAGRRRGRAAQPRAHARCRRSLPTAWQDGQDLDLAVADPAGADAAVPEGRHRRSRVVLSVEGPLRPGDAAERAARGARVRAVARRRAARSGDAALHGARASRASRSSRSRTSATRSGCSSWRCCSIRWWRGCARRRGTSSLRAVVYMDEIVGYFPPVANPPSKAPLLTLLKQGRAFGVGVLLATQNPVDLDYKGLANTGTWFLGRLQTERDKARMLDGLEGRCRRRARSRRPPIGCCRRSTSACSSCTTSMPSGPIVFQTRWTLSYLRGPLSRDQIRTLTRRLPPATASLGGCRLGAAGGRSARPPPRRALIRETPIVPPGIEQFFVPAAESARPTSIYAPVVLGSARVGFSDAKNGIDESRDVLYAANISDGAVPVDWTARLALDVSGRRPRPRSRPRTPGRTRCRRRAAGEELRNWQKDVQPLARAVRDARAFPPPRLEADLHAGRERARLPDPPAGREPRRARRGGRRDPPEVRHEAGRSSPTRLRRAEASVEREQQQASQSQAPDDGLGRGDARRRVPRSKGGQHRHARAGHDRRPRRWPEHEGVRGRQARGRERGGRARSDQAISTPRSSGETQRIAARFESRGPAREDVADAQARAAHGAVRGARLDAGGRPDSYVIPCRRAEGTRRSDTDRAQETPDNPSPPHSDRTAEPRARRLPSAS